MSLLDRTASTQGTKPFLCTAQFKRSLGIDYGAMVNDNEEAILHLNQTPDSLHQLLASVTDLLL